MTKIYKSYEKIKEDMERRQRVPKRWTKKDVAMIRQAKKDGDWAQVHSSKLYIRHGGDYCTLLEVLNNDID